jgi:predicted HD phosphohydrolase
LLHDIGHPLNDQGSSPTLQSIDDQHQYFAIPSYGRYLGTVDPIRWHVNAKRYLCATQVHYWNGLSAGSATQSALQGGVYSTEQQAQAFITQAQAQRAVKLRDLGRPGQNARHVDTLLTHSPQAQSFALMQTSSS